MTDEHFAKANEALQNPMQQRAEMRRHKRQSSMIAPQIDAEKQGIAIICDYLPKGNIFPD